MFFFTSVASAQINKGQFLVGGNASFKYEDSYGKSSEFNVSPGAGYFFLDKLAGGLKMDFSGRTTYSNGEKISRSRGYGVSPFVRYYVLPATNKLNVFAQATYGWGKTSYKNPFDDISLYKTNKNSYSFTAGPVFFLSRHVALEFTAGYHHSTVKDNLVNNGKLVTKGFQTGVGLQIHLGK